MDDLTNEAIELFERLDDSDRQFMLTVGRALAYAPRGEGTALANMMWRGYEQQLRDKLARMMTAGAPQR